MTLTSHKNKANCLHKRSKLLRRIAGGLLCFLLIAAISFFIAISCIRKDFTPPQNTEQWLTGDLFFSVGNTWRSLIVRMFDGNNSEGLTHCGFVMVEDGQPYLVHMSTEKNKIVRESIDEYAKVNDVNAIIVKRLKEPVDTVLLRQTITSLMNEGKEFDHDFDHRDSTRYYCTEFVINTLSKTGCHKFDDLFNKDYVYPVDIANRDVFISDTKR